LPVLLIVLLEALAVALALSVDAFLACFAYGSGKIKIPLLSVLIISAVCSGILGISLLFGSAVRPYIPLEFTKAICFCILFILGIIKLLDGVIKSVIRKYNSFNKEIKFSIFDLKFIINLYANPEDADIDASREISPKEALSLSFALSLDGLAVGFGAALGNINFLLAILCSLLIGALAVIAGCGIGNRLAGKLPFNISWMSGALLMVLAVIKLF